MLDYDFSLIFLGDCKASDWDMLVCGEGGGGGGRGCNSRNGTMHKILIYLAPIA